MSGAPQLERSVLEGKERDELQAIAEALGHKPASRAKKAELVDLILRATGVAGPPPDTNEVAKPKRVTRKRVAAPPPEGNGAAAPTLELDQPSTSSPAPGAPAPGRDPEGPVAASPPEPAPAVGEAVQAPVEEPVGATVAVVPAEARAARSTPEPSTEPRPPPSRLSPQPTGPPGPGNHAAPPARPGQPGPQGQSHQPGGPGPQAQQPVGPNQPGQPAQAGPGPDGEVRRNRRRRGRDRMVAGYDQQVQQGDQAYVGDPLSCDGLLELRPEGFGFLRTGGYLPGPDDVYVSTSQVRKFALRAGDRIVGASRPATTQERYGALLRIDAVGDLNPEQARRRPRFNDLTPLFPDDRLTLELSDPADPATTTGRIIDLLAPIGKGQRAMIVSPPKAGKTTVMKHIATAIAANHPDVDLMVLLVDERPEEVTDMRRSVRGEVIGSTFDRPAEEHTQVAELVIEVAKRRVELGRDVVIILDGITRLARAYNLAAPATGRVMSGGIDSGALGPPKRFFGAARNLEEGGSLTILATALVETGSTMDTVIFEEFKGTGNAELRLDRRLAERRMYPAIDVTASSTRHEELLLSKEELHAVWQLRRVLVALGQESGGQKAYELLLDRLKHSRSNTDFLADLARTPS
ncbi:MAG: transcription termination factor Rho [Acidimicrobiales bacterium]